MIRFDGTLLLMISWGFVSYFLLNNKHKLNHAYI